METNSSLNGSMTALDDDLAMLRSLEINLTCFECLEVCQGEEELETLQSCGHTFCLRCINERLDKIKLPFKNQPNKTLLLSGDPKTASRRLALLVAVRCSTCHKLSKHPLLNREFFGNCENNSEVNENSDKSPLLSSRSPISSSDGNSDSALSSTSSTSSSTYSSAPCLLNNNSSSSNQALSLDETISNSNDKSVTIRSNSQLQLLVPNLVHIYVKDLFGRTTLVVIDAEQRFGDFKRKLANLLKIPVAELQVRFFQRAADGEDENLSFLYDKATLRLLNAKPSSAWWWRPAFFAAQNMPIFAHQ